jgi:hypothetical protein
MTVRPDAALLGLILLSRKPYNTPVWKAVRE